MFTLLFASTDVFCCFPVFLLFVATKPKENSKKFEKGREFFQSTETGVSHQKLHIFKILLPLNGVILLVTRMSLVLTQHLEHHLADITDLSTDCVFIFRLFALQKGDLPMLALFFQELEFGSNQILKSSPFTFSYTGS